MSSWLRIVLRSNLLLLFCYSATPLRLNETIHLPDPWEKLQKNGLNTSLLQDELEDMGFQLEVDSFNASHALPKAMRRRKPMMWVHIHKSAGSFICAGAVLNGESIVKPSGNCNWAEHDNGAGGLGSERTNCSKRTEYFEQHNYSWGQIERVLADEFCYTTFDYGIWLRDPVSLAESEANWHHMYTPGEISTSLNCVVQKRGELCPVKQKDDMPLWMYFDNYVVRIVGGPSVWNLPPGHVEERHARLALERLHPFKIVLVMEDVVSTEHGTDALFKKTGWKLWPVKSKRYHTHNKTFTNEERETIRKLNKYDYMLYDWASTKHV